MNSTLTSTEKGYLLGLLVGGGNLGPGGFTITLPLKSWGAVRENPARAGQISKDVLDIINPMFQSIYGIGVSFAAGRDWVLSGHSFPQKLAEDLAEAGLPTSGELRSHANATRILNGGTAAYKRAFVKGLADSIGSLAQSHRRFTNDYQVVSLEFSGFNFELVASIARILTSIGCTLDQILWNLPNQHSGEDRYYTSWKKGMKIRVMLGDFGDQAGFGFTSKVLGARENQKLQTNPKATHAPEKIVPSAKCLHVDENSPQLPNNIRGRHFLHWQHVAALFDTQTVTRIKLETLLANSLELSSPFTLLTKNTSIALQKNISTDPFLGQINFKLDADFRPMEVLRAYHEGQKSWIIGVDSKFDLTRMVEAILFPLLAEGGETSGRRYRGPLIDHVRNAISSRSVEIDTLEVRRDPTHVSPILFSYGEYSAMVGPISPRLNAQVFNIDTNNLEVTYDLEKVEHVRW